MPSDHGGTPRALGKDRMEGYSDGVFGFAATLLVINLALRPPGTALQQLVHAWPSFVAYIISFLTIGTGWLAHTGMSDRLARTDRIFLRLNLLLLLVVVFLPFPTRLVADALYHPSSERVFVTLYGLTILAIRILGAALDRYARRQHLYAPHEDRTEPEGEQPKFLPVVIGYVIAILIGLALPDLAVALYFGIAVYAIVPFREVGRLVFRRALIPPGARPPMATGPRGARNGCQLVRRQEVERLTAAIGAGRGPPKPQFDPAPGSRAIWAAGRVPGRPRQPGSAGWCAPSTLRPGRRDGATRN